MKIKSIKLSNILSFKYADNLDDATGIEFNDNLNIIIGENGAGKSTILEAINFVFRKVIFKKVNYIESYLTDNVNRKLTVQIDSNQNYDEYRLEPNWNTVDKPQHIIIEIKFDDIDKRNIEIIQAHDHEITEFNKIYSSVTFNKTITLPIDNLLKIKITLNNDVNKTYSVTYTPDNCTIQEYLEKYEFILKMIELYNRNNGNRTIVQLNDPFALLSAFRNYGIFNRTISLQQDTPQNQIYNTRQQDYLKSINAIESQEPVIFNLVRLRIASEHFNLTDTMPINDNSIEKANKLDFINSINRRLAVINLKCELRLVDKRTWAYEFVFTDIKYDQELGNINNLSAGQK